MNFWCTILLYNLLRFLVHASSTEKKRALCDTFFRNREPNRVTEINLNYLQNMLIYYPSGEYELSTRSFKEEYCYRIVFVHKGCLVHDRKEHTFFSALNLTMICFSFSRNNTIFSVSFSNYYFSIKHSLLTDYMFLSCHACISE